MRFCSLASGSSGNCILIGSENTSILVDAGVSGKKIEEGLNSIDMTLSDIDAIVVTHEHSDHIKGLGVLARRRGMRIFMTQGTADAVEKNTAVGKIPKELINPIVADMSFAVGDLVVRPFKISHDAAEPVGYAVECGKCHAAVATDMGCYTDYTVRQLKEADVLLLEANHDVRMLQAGPYPYPLKKRILSDVGHLSNESSGQLLGKVLSDHTKHVFLGHLSLENNYDRLAYETVCGEVTAGDNPYDSKDFPIEVAPRDRAGTPVFW